MVVAVPTEEAIAQWIASLDSQGVKYVRFELPDLHGVSRLKVVPLAKAAGYAKKGLNFYGGTLALDTASSVVGGSGYHEERKYQDHLLLRDYYQEFHSRLNLQKQNLQYDQNYHLSQL